MTRAGSLFRGTVLGPRSSAALAAKPIYWSLRLILGALFIWAGVLKFLDLDAFARVILAYDLVPEALVAPVAIGIPAAEIVSGLGAIRGYRFAFWWMLALLSVFLVVLWFGILKDLDIDCGCFSLAETASHVTLAQAFVRDLLFVLGVMYLLAWPRLAAAALGRGGGNPDAERA